MSDVVQKERKTRVRGPQGTVKTAKITVLAASNPKPEGGEPSRIFDQYFTNPTIEQFTNALKAMGLKHRATPSMVYDAKQGFIHIEGYAGNKVKSLDLPVLEEAAPVHQDVYQPATEATPPFAGTTETLE